MVSITLLYTGSKQNMDRLEQLFIEEKFHPLNQTFHRLQMFLL